MSEPISEQGTCNQAIGGVIQARTPLGRDSGPELVELVLQPMPDQVLSGVPQDYAIAPLHYTPRDQPVKSVAASITLRCPTWQSPLCVVVPDGIDIKCRSCRGVIYASISLSVPQSRLPAHALVASSER